MISSCKYFDLRTKTEKNNSEPRQEKEMNKEDLQYCCNCLNFEIRYDGTGYIFLCTKHKKEVGYYQKPCKEYK